MKVYKTVKFEKEDLRKIEDFFNWMKEMDDEAWDALCETYPSMSELFDTVDCLRLNAEECEEAK